MVLVKDDSLKHLTRKNGFCRAEQQPKVINSFEMLRKMERKRCEEGRRVTWRAIERDKDVKREEDERDEEKNNRRAEGRDSLKEIKAPFSLNPTCKVDLAF